jgi:class 3 adenylate cyclase
MGLKDSVSEKVKDILEGDYEIEDVDEIPSPQDVPFGKKAKKMKVCVLYIDLRDSSNLLFVHQKQTAGKIHKAFLHAVASTVLDFGGNIRGFKGDSLMALWPANYKSQVSTCVKAAMTIKWLLDVELQPQFETYSAIDFGIGVDWGEVLIARAGIPRDATNNDLVFMGKCINFAVAIGEQAKGPEHVEISKVSYENLDDAVIYGSQKDFFGNDQKVDMWKDGSVQWKSTNYPTKLTTGHWKSS